MPSRTWIKIYCDKWLGGTIREETPEVRGIWVDLITLAGSGRFGDTGHIKLSNNIGMTDEQIAGILQITQELWNKAKKRLAETNRISFNGDNIISIINWNKYQSEYERQKSYREKLQTEVTSNSYGEKEKEKEKENRIDNNKRKSNKKKSGENGTHQRSAKVIRGFRINPD